MGFETFLCEDCSPTHPGLFGLQALTITIPGSCVSSVHVDHFNFCVFGSIVLDLGNLLCVPAYCIFIKQFRPSQGLSQRSYGISILIFVHLIFFSGSLHVSNIVNKLMLVWCRVFRRVGPMERVALVKVVVVEAHDLVAIHWGGTSDPYVSVCYGNIKMRTKVS